MNCWYTHVVQNDSNNVQNVQNGFSHNVQNVQNGFSHNVQNVQNSSANLGFHQSQDNPPDPMMGNLTQMFVENCVMNVLQRKEYQNYRSQGH